MAAQICHVKTSRTKSRLCGVYSNTAYNRNGGSYLAKVLDEVNSRKKSRAKWLASYVSQNLWNLGRSEISDEVSGQVVHIKKCE